MNKAIKWIFGLAGLLIVLIIAAIIILPMVIDPDDYKDEILAQVKKTTGRDLSIRDPLELAVFPALAVRLGGVSLGNAPGFGEQPFAQVEELDLRVAVLPILSGRLEVDTVVLRGLALNLARDAQGKSNWEDLASAEPAPEPQEPAALPLQVQIQGVIVDDARVVWDDRQADTRYELSGLDVETGAIAPGRSIPVTIAMTLASETPPRQIELALATAITVNDAVTRFDLDDFELDLNATGEGLPQGGLDLAVTGRASYDSAAGTVAVEDLAVSGAGLQLDGALNGTGMNTNPSIEGRFELRESNLRQVLALFAAAPETADPKALTRVSAELGIAASDSSAALEPFTVMIDDSTLTGDFEVTSFAGPAVRFALQLDRIDLDRYLPPPAEGEAQAKPAAAETTGAQVHEGNPLAALRELSLQGSVEVGSVKIAGLTSTGIEVRVNASDGLLQVQPMRAKLYEGELSAAMSLDARAETPRIAVTGTVLGVQAGPLLADMTGKEFLTGQGRLDLDIEMRGLDAAAAKRSLNGTTRFEFKDGTYKGLDVVGTICSVSGKISNLLKGATGEVDTAGETPFSELTGSAAITDGVVVNEDLELRSPLLRVNGAGKIDLPQDALDYLVRAELVAACKGQGGAGADQLVGVPLPIRASGALAEPKFAPDWGALAKSLAGSDVKEKAEELIKDKVKLPAGDGEDGGVGDTLKKGLKGLL